MPFNIQGGVVQFVLVKPSCLYSEYLEYTNSSKLQWIQQNGDWGVSLFPTSHCELP